MEEEQSLSSDHIFVLSGQSNMSGRGGVHHRHWDHIVPPACSPHPSILRLSSHSHWIRAHAPLHADIDVHKTCGVGPGMPFAHSILNSLPSARIGLVPCAVGGTAISEWERGRKLYEDMIMRSKRAAESSGGVIKAVVWYQGESDTDSEAKAGVYKEKMERLVRDVRSDLGMPNLPFVQVALASGVKRELVEVVRKAQLGIQLENVVTVDAMGLALNPDGLHLTTDSQVSLGKMLAEAYLGGFCGNMAV